MRVLLVLTISLLVAFAIILFDQYQQASLLKPVQPASDISRIVKALERMAVAEEQQVK